MPAKDPVSLVACERLRDHQSVAAKAVNAHGPALARLDAVVARRAEVLSTQDSSAAAIITPKWLSP
jgi:hypothetical protein